MKYSAIVLFGPPAAGKDTVTAQLERIDPRYAQYERLKCGTGTLTRYRPATQSQLDHLRKEGLVLYENSRYGNTYVIDKPHLDAMLEADLTPVLHLGQLQGVRAVSVYPATWAKILLWCSRSTTEQRARSRGSTDIADRLRAWDETAAELSASGDECFTFKIDTEAVDPAEAAMRIHRHVHGSNLEHPKG